MLQQRNEGVFVLFSKFNYRINKPSSIITTTTTIIVTINVFQNIKNN